MKSTESQNVGNRKGEKKERHVQKTIESMKVFFESHTVGIEVERTTYPRYWSASWIFPTAVAWSARRWLEIMFPFS